MSCKAAAGCVTWANGMQMQDRRYVMEILGEFALLDASKVVVEGEWKQ